MCDKTAKNKWHFHWLINRKDLFCFFLALKCTESTLRQFSPCGCEKVFYAFVLAELLPRQLLWRCFWSSHSSCTPACAPVTVSQTKYFTFVISVDVRTGCGLGCVFNMSLMENREFCYNILIHSILLSRPPNRKFLIVVNFYRLFGFPSYYGMYCILQGQRKSQHFSRVINRLCVSYLAKPGSTSIRTSDIPSVLFLSLPHICSPCYYRNWTHCLENDS